MGSAVFISDPNHEFDLTVVLGPGGGLPFKRDVGAPRKCFKQPLRGTHFLLEIFSAQYP